MMGYSAFIGSGASPLSSRGGSLHCTPLVSPQRRASLSLALSTGSGANLGSMSRRASNASGGLTDVGSGVASMLITPPLSPRSMLPTPVLSPNASSSATGVGSHPPFNFANYSMHPIGASSSAAATPSSGLRGSGDPLMSSFLLPPHPLSGPNSRTASGLAHHHRGGGSGSHSLFALNSDGSSIMGDVVGGRGPDIAATPPHPSASGMFPFTHSRDSSSGHSDWARNSMDIDVTSAMFDAFQPLGSTPSHASNASNGLNTAGERPVGMLPSLHGSHMHPALFSPQYSVSSSSLHLMNGLNPSSSASASSTPRFLRDPHLRTSSTTHTSSHTPTSHLSVSGSSTGPASQVHSPSQQHILSSILAQSNTEGSLTLHRKLESLYLAQANGDMLASEFMASNDNGASAQVKQEPGSVAPAPTGFSMVTRKRPGTRVLIDSASVPASPSPSSTTKAKKSARKRNNGEPFLCELCHKTFTQKGGLQNHMRIHRNEKPFACAVPGCTRAFAQKCNLTRHQRCHTGEKPFKCGLCERAFNRRFGLMQHMAIHNPDATPPSGRTPAHRNAQKDTKTPTVILNDSIGGSDDSNSLLGHDSVSSHSNKSTVSVTPTGVFEAAMAAAAAASAPSTAPLATTPFTTTLAPTATTTTTTQHPNTSVWPIARHAQIAPMASPSAPLLPMPIMARPQYPHAHAHQPTSPLLSLVSISPPLLPTPLAHAQPSD